MMSTRSRTYPARSTQRPLGGHLHEMATTRPVPTPRTWWHNPYLDRQGLMLGPQTFVLGQPGSGKGRRQPGHGKTALVRELHIDASRRRFGPSVIFDEAAVFTPVLPLVAGGAIDPLAWAPRRSTSSARTAGEW